MLHQVTQEMKLPRRKVDELAVAGDRSPQQGFNAGEQFHSIEWFCDVVIGTQLQTNDLINSLASSSQQEDRGGQACYPDPATDVETATARQHNIEDDQVKGQMSCLLKTLFAISSDIDDVALASQAIAQRHLQRFFVFYQQDALVHFSTVGFGPEAPLTICNLCSSATCRYRVKTLPTSSSLTTERSPPMASARLFDRDNPKPVP